MKDLTTQGFSQIAHFFDSQLPGFFLAIPKYSSGAWGQIWDGPKGFYQDVVVNLMSFFNKDIPNWTKTIGANSPPPGARPTTDSSATWRAR